MNLFFIDYLKNIINSYWAAFPRIITKLSRISLQIIDFFRRLLERSIYLKREKVIGLDPTTTQYIRLILGLLPLQQML